MTKRSRGWLALALLFVALRALPNISYPMHRDQATYCVVAQDLLHGAKLYRDVWDNKPPGIFWIYELIVKLFGPVMWSVGVVDVLWLLVISWCVFRFAEHYLGLGSAVGAVLVNAHLHCRAAGYVNAAQTESFLILFIFLAYFLVWRQGRWTLARHFAAGLVFGGAFWLKYNAVAFLPLLLLVPYLDLNGLDSAPLRPRLRVPWRAWLERSITLVAGWSTVSVAVLAYFWQAGLWSVLWESHFAVLPGYGASPVGRESYLTLAVLRTTYHLGLFTFVAPWVAVWVAWRTRELARFTPVFVGAGTAYASAAMGVHFHPPAFEACYPFYAMVWGYLAVKMCEARRTLDRGFAARGERLARVGLVVAAGAAVLGLLAAEVIILVENYRDLARWSQSHEEFYAHYPSPFPLEDLEGQMQVIRLVKADGASQDGPQGELYVWGYYDLIYYATGLRPPTRFISFFPLKYTFWGRPEWRQELMRDLEKSPPAYFVVSRREDLGIFPQLESFVSRSYKPYAVFAQFSVYRRRAGS